MSNISQNLAKSLNGEADSRPLQSGGFSSLFEAIGRSLPHFLLACSLFPVPSSLLAGETGTIVAPGGGVITYTNADAKSAFDFLSHREGAERAQGERRVGNE